MTPIRIALIAIAALLLAGCAQIQEIAETALEDVLTPATSTPTHLGDSANHTLAGSLGPGDMRLSSDEYMDEYRIYLRAGQTIRVELKSSEFDPYLVVIAPSGEQEDNDDYENSRSRSFIEWEVPEEGEYRILATSYRGRERGDYNLNVRLVGTRHNLTNDQTTGDEDSPSVLRGVSARDNAYAFRQDDEVLAVGTNRGTIQLWSTSGPPELLTVMSGMHNGEIFRGSLCFSPDGTLLASVGREDGLLVVWDVQRGQRLWSRRLYRDPDDIFFFVSHVDFDYESDYIAVDGDVTQVFRADNGTSILLPTSANGSKPHSYSWHPFLQTISLGYVVDRSLILFDVVENDVIFRDHNLNSSPSYMVFSPDGSWLYSSGYDAYYVDVFDLTRQTSVQPFRIEYEEGGPSIIHLTISDDGQFLVAYSADVNSSLHANIFNTATSGLVATFDNPYSRLRFLRSTHVLMSDYRSGVEVPGLRSILLPFPRLPDSFGVTFESHSSRIVVIVSYDANEVALLYASHTITSELTLRYPLDRPREIRGGLRYRDHWLNRFCIEPGLRDKPLLHAGVDYYVPRFGEAVYAVAPGTVRYARPDAASGGYIVVEHTASDGSKFTTTYTHVAPSVSSEQTVTDRTQLGVTARGSEGYGAHLDFKIRMQPFSQADLTWILRGRFPEVSCIAKRNGPREPAFPEHTIDPEIIQWIAR